MRRLTVSGIEGSLGSQAQESTDWFPGLHLHPDVCGPASSPVGCGHDSCVYTSCCERALGWTSRCGVVFFSGAVVCLPGFLSQVSRSASISESLFCTVCMSFSVAPGARGSWTYFIFFLPSTNQGLATWRLREK